MSAIHDLIGQISDPRLRERLAAEWKAASTGKKFGLVAGIEAEFNVRVLYACESGSRGWGFASPDSDYDVRFIYVHPLPWYLKVSVQRDVIEVPISDELDINGWELRKALGLLKKGNATLIEWLDSPVVYRADGDFLQTIRDAARLASRCWQNASRLDAAN